MVDALDDYQGQGFNDINGTLRGSRGYAGLSGETKALVDNMDDAFKAAAPLGQDTYVYRYAYMHADDAAPMFGAGGVPKVGTVFKDQGFVSTSMHQGPWKFGGLGEEYYKGGIYNYRIRLPKGTKSCVLPEYMNEAEIVVKRSSNMRIVKVSKVGTRRVEIYDEGVINAPVYEVDVEVIP